MLGLVPGMDTSFHSPVILLMPMTQLKNHELQELLLALMCSNYVSISITNQKENLS